MRSESEYLGDLVTARLCQLYVLDLTVVVVKDRREAVIALAPGCSLSSSKQQRRCLVAGRRSSHAKPVGSLSRPKTQCRAPTAMPVAIEQADEGTSPPACTLHPEFFEVASEHPGLRCRVRDRVAAGLVETGVADFAGRRRWITSLTSFFAELWLIIRHAREIRRIRAVWETIDDRTLKDIGVSRYEIEYATEARHWR
jgi:uncharacterized protein YjiS (DUF1127 family)